jgi:ABC-type thiamine transport system ATPase subunit
MPAELSGGERQRVALARVHAARADPSHPLTPLQHPFRPDLFVNSWLHFDL